MANNNESSFFDKFLALGAFAGAASYSAYRHQNKYGTFGPSEFTPTLDPRANILSRIQSIDIDNAFSRAVKKFQLEHALNKVTAYQNKIELLNKLERASFVGNINDIRGQLQQHVTGNGPLGPNFTSHSSVLNMSNKTFESLKESTMLESNRSLIRTEWEAAIKATFPNPLEAHAFSLTDSPFEGIRASLKGNNSILMQRAFHTFERNMDKLLDLGQTTALSLMNVSDFIKSTPSVGVAREIGMSDITDTRLRSTIEQIEANLGRPLTISRRDIAGVTGQGELQFGFKGKKSPLFTIPEAFSAAEGAAPGLIRTGAGLHNVYAPGIFGIADETGNIMERLNFSQFKAQQVLNTVLSQNLNADTPGLTRYLSEAEENVSKLADYMEPNISGQDFSFETITKGNQISVLDQQARYVSGDARRHVAQALYASGATPAGARSRFSLTAEEQLHGPFASSQDYARKPWQFARQYMPTSSAQEAFLSSPLSASEFGFLDSPAAIKAFGGPGGARAKTLYLSEDQIFMLAQMGHKIEDGELLLHESMKAQLQVSRIKRINLQELDTQVANLVKADGATLENLQQTNLSSLKYKGVLGRNPEGRVITTRYPTELIGLSPTVTQRLDKTTNTGLDLLIRETIGMSNSEKVFGSLKGMARFVPGDSEFMSAMSQVTGLSTDELSGITAFARADDIKDNARKLSALTSNYILEAQRAGIAVDSSSIVSQIKTMEPEAAERFLAARASSQGFETSLSVANKTGGIAVSQLYYGGMKELTGAGNAATVEPRLFTMLNASNPGGLGEEITSDFLERMIRGSPDRLVMHEELMKTLGSLEGSVVPTQGQLVVEPSEVANKAKMDEIFKRGGFVKTGVDKIPQIYIPGYETVPQLHPRMVGTGAVVDTSEPGKIFRNIVSDIKNLSASNPLSEEDFIAKFEKDNGYLTRLFQETAVGGKGAGSIARGVLPGSRSGVLLSTVDNIPFEKIKSTFNVPSNISERIAGIPRHFAESMLSEMEQLHGQEAMAPMRKRLMSGELVAGMGQRHPIIDAYSSQPMLMKMVDTDQNVILMSETMKQITTDKGKSFVNVGPFAGWGADKDIDNVQAMLLSPGLEEKLRTQMLDNNSVIAKQFQEYSNHSVRMQLLKPKAAKGVDVGATLAERRAAEATKLAIPSEQVGLLSTQITKAHVALGASNLDDARKLRASSLLTWIEQTPISGKHLSVNKALGGLFEQQMEAFKMGVGGNPALLEGSIASIAKDVPSDLQDLFGKGKNIEGLGFVKGWDVPESVRDITNAVQEFRGLPAGAQLSAASRFATPSTGASVGFEQLSNVIMANQIRPPAAATTSARNALAAINRELSGVVNKARPFAKPLALGALAAGATMAMFGPGPSAMPPPEQRTNALRSAPAPAPVSAPDRAPPENLQLTNPTRDNVEIPGVTKQVLGEPSVSPHLQQRAVQLDQTGSDRRRSLRATIRTNNITAQQRQGLVNRLNGRYPGNQMNINVQDDRRTLNPHAISDLLQ